jgi:pyruvate/2-oxoglutarate dehydrogenase complex dihydrolipoamide acyltransferase (E2) component
MQAIGAVATDLGARFQNALGVVLGPALQFAASGIQNLYGWLSATFSALANSPVGEFIADFAKVAGIGAVLIGIIALAPQVGAALAAAFAIVTGPLGAVIALAAILGAVVVETTGKGETFGEKMRDVFASIPEVIETLSFAFRNFGAIAQIAIIDLVTSAIELFPQMEGPLTTVAEFFISTFSGLKAFFSTIIQNIIGALKEVANFARAVGAGLKSAWDAISTGNFKEVSERFGKAFTETLAAQANVAAPNAFEAFRDAYAKAGTEFNASIKQGGGLRNTLDARRRQLLDQVAKTETARQAKVPTSKAIPAAQMIIERAQPKAEPVEEARKVSAYEATAAATRGSSEAWSRIVSAMAGPGQAAKADEQTAENTKEMLDGIHELVRIGRDGRTELVNL